MDALHRHAGVIAEQAHPDRSAGAQGFASRKGEATHLTHTCRLPTPAFPAA